MLHSKVKARPRQIGIQLGRGALGQALLPRSGRARHLAQLTYEPYRDALIELVTPH
jgi:hypothetical protein